MSDELMLLVRKIGCIHYGDMTFYWRNDAIVVRPRRNRNASGKHWKRTEARERANDKFNAGRAMADHVVDVLEELVAWQLEAGSHPGSRRTAKDYVFSANSTCIGYDDDDRGRAIVTDCPHFKLTAGKLARGRDITARREGNGIRLTWKTGDGSRLEGADDVLHAGILYDAERDGFDIARDVARRGDCTAFIPLDAPGGIVHVYPFFGKKNRTIFSENDYFTVEVEKIAPRRRDKKENDDAVAEPPREEGRRETAVAAERDIINDNEDNSMKKRETWIMVPLVALLSSFASPVTRAEGAAPPADSTRVFRFVPGDDMFYVPWGGNGAALDALVARVRECRPAIDSGLMFLAVAGYAPRDTAAGDSLVYTRCQRVKSELIRRAGVREEHFLTDRVESVPYRGKDEPARAVYDVVTVTFPAATEKIAEKLGDDVARRARQYNEELFARSPEGLRLAAERKLREEEARLAAAREAERTREEAAIAARREREAAEAARAAEAAARAESERARRGDAATGRYLVAKTNVVAWAVTALNVAVEVQVGTRLTVDVPLSWCPWDVSDRHAARFFLVQPEARRWFASPGRGHFLGIHAHAGWFNVKWDRDRYQDAGRPLWGVGASYGYALSLGGRWGAELTLGAGYANMKYDTLYNIKDGARVDTRSRDYWGITRAGINVVYKFNMKGTR